MAQYFKNSKWCTVESLPFIPVSFMLGSFPHRQPNWPISSVEPLRDILCRHLDLVNESFFFSSACLWTINVAPKNLENPKKNISTQNIYYCLICSHEKSEIIWIPRMGKMTVSLRLLDIHLVIIMKHVTTHKNAYHKIFKTIHKRRTRDQKILNLSFEIKTMK